jgi:hypothetical protein
MGSAGRAAAAVIMVLVAVPGWADGPSASAGLEAEVDGDGGYGYAIDATWYAGPRTRLFLGGNYADTTASVSGLATKGISAGAGRDFGRLSLDAWYDQWQDNDVVTARSVNAALYIPAGDFTLSLLAQLRESDFEPFDASATVALRSGEQVVINAVADCELDDSGLGLALGWQGDRLEGYLRGMQYDYDDVACGFDSPLLERLRRNRPAIFAQFAPRVIGPLAANATSRIGAENALLDYSLGAGLGWDAGARRYGLDYLHQRDYFTGLEAGTLSASVTFRLEAGPDLTLEGGATDGDYGGTAWFAGIGLRKLF